MLGKMTVYASNLLNVKLNKLSQKISSKLNNRDGMEMLQMILIIGIAVMVGGAVYMLIKNTLGDANADSGLLGKIKDRLTNLMNFD